MKNVKRFWVPVIAGVVTVVVAIALAALWDSRRPSEAGCKDAIRTVWSKSVTGEHIDRASVSECDGLSDKTIQRLFGEVLKEQFGQVFK